MSELKDCPFCGTPVSGPHCQEYVGDNYDPHWWIECPNIECGAFMEMEEIEDVVSAWNSRNSPNVHCIYHGGRGCGNIKLG